MRVAAIYDIHGNLPALEAVLADVRRASVDHVVVGGDVFPGPLSSEALALLLELEIPATFIRGNGDREALAIADGAEPASVPERYRPAMRWVAETLTPEHRRIVGSWPETARLRIDRLGEVLFCHATPRSDTEIFVRTTPDDRLAPIFEPAGALLVVCGHTHMPFDRTIGRVRVVNAGSVGMPFGEPGADWLLLGPGVEPRRTRYDLEKAAERVRATSYPDAREFAERSILKPPSEEEMLSLFSKAEIR